MDKLFRDFAIAASLAGAVFAICATSAYADCTPASVDPSCPLSMLSPANPQNPANIAQQQAQQQVQQQVQQRILEQQQAAYNALSPGEKCQQARQSLACALGIMCEPIGIDCGRRFRAR